MQCVPSTFNNQQSRPWWCLPHPSPSPMPPSAPWPTMPSYGHQSPPLSEWCRCQRDGWALITLQVRFFVWCQLIFAADAQPGQLAADYSLQERNSLTDFYWQSLRLFISISLCVHLPHFCLCRHHYHNTNTSTHNPHTYYYSYTLTNSSRILQSRR